ncbi:MAG: hypothetical protein ABIF08_02125 [Nanoarchaeota archaeon]
MKVHVNVLILKYEDREPFIDESGQSWLFDNNARQIYMAKDRYIFYTLELDKLGRTQSTFPGHVFNMDSADYREHMPELRKMVVEVFDKYGIHMDEDKMKPINAKTFWNSEKNDLEAYEFYEIGFEYVDMSNLMGKTKRLKWIRDDVGVYESIANFEI